MLLKVVCIVYMAYLLVDFLVGSVLKVDISGEVNKKCDFVLCVEIDALRVSFCFRSLHISDILWKYI